MKAFTQMKEAAFGDKPRERDEAQLSFQIGLGLRREQRRTGKKTERDVMGRTHGPVDDRWLDC